MLRAPAHCVCFAAMLALTATQTVASGPVKIIVPYPPSGTSDFLARLIAPRMSETLGVPVVVDNRPGASGNIGMSVVAKSPSDGSVLVMTNSVVAMNVALFPGQSFDIKQDFEPLGLIGSTPMAVTINPSVPSKTLGELTAYLKQNPGKLNFGSCGHGTPQHLAIELYLAMAAVSMRHVPYNGCAQAVTDIVGGQIQVLAATTLQAAPQVNAGALRALAVTSLRRSLMLPQVPTFQEAGLSGYSLDIWFGLMAPVKTPDSILSQIHRIVRDIIESPEIVKRMRASGVEDLVTTRQEHAAVLAADLTKFARLIGDLNLARSSK